MKLFSESFKNFESIVGYELIREIGRGTFARVYLGVRRGYGLDRYVAIKVVDMRTMGEKHRTVIMDEARITGKLSHPNVIHIYDCGVLADQYFFIVSELINGYSLKEVIAEHTREVMAKLKGMSDIPLSLMKNATASILMHSARGLSYIHHAVDLLTGDPLHVVHNDLKPGNILIGLDGSLKVSDFGISYSPMRSVRLKGGSPAYMAPEWIDSLLGEDAYALPDQTMDVYSLGVCLHETLTARRLFRAPRPNMERDDMLRDIHTQMSSFHPGKTREVNPAADRHLSEIADRCLEFSPKNRFQSMTEIIQEVDNLIEERVYHPEILDRRFLAEYMETMFPGGEYQRFCEKLI